MLLRGVAGFAVLAFAAAGGFAAAAAEPSATLVRAMTALRGLESATVAGLTYPEYLRRLADAKAEFDRLDRGSRNSPAGEALARALGYYVAAAKVWGADTDPGNVTWGMLAAALPREADRSMCGPVQAIADEAAKERAGGHNDFTGTVEIPPIWACASKQLAEAQRLLK